MSKHKKHKKSKGGKGSGLMKEMQCSEELQAVIKKEKVSRGKCSKYLWEYIKRKGLQSKKSGRIIEPDKKLAAVTGKKPFDMMKLGGFISNHLSSISDE